jgi:hypothetical protein
MHAIARRSRPFALAATLLAVAACGDSTSPESALTAEEANELAFQMGALFSANLTTLSASAAQSSAESAARTSAVPQPINASFDATVRCPGGGSTRLSAEIDGTIDDATEFITADITVTSRNRPSNCGLDVHGRPFRITGELTATAHARIEDGVPVGEQTATLDGSFRWRTDGGRHGSCTVSYRASANYTTNVAVVNGNFCGTTINVTGPVTFGPVGGL